MRISDWSSDVCSSDLIAQRGQQRTQDLADPGLVHAAVAGVDALAEVAAREVRHRIIGKAVARAADVMDADDVRVFQPRDRARLVLDAPPADPLAQPLGPPHLYRTLPRPPKLPPPVH